MPNSTTARNQARAFMSWSGVVNSPFVSPAPVKQEKVEQQKQDFSEAFFDYYSCPSHQLKGYLGMSREMLKELKILSKMSKDSKINPVTGKIYLDIREDSPLFFQAYKKKYGKKPNIIEKPVDTYFMSGVEDFSSFNQ